MKRKPITLTKQEAITLVNSLGGGGHIYRGKMLNRLIDKLRRRVDEDIPGTEAYEERARKAQP